MPQTMTPEQRRSFLTEGTLSAILATTGADGHPHAVPLWYALDGDDVLMNISETTIKGGNVLRDPRVAVTVHADAFPYSFVLMQGIADIVRDPETLRHGSELIARRYLPEEAREGWMHYATGPGKVLLRVRPTHTVAVAGVAS